MPYQPNADLAASARSAPAPIRGFLYQSWVAVAHWLELGPDEALVCEGREDVDRWFEGGCAMDQVKALSGNLTIKSVEVRKSLAGYLETFVEFHEAGQRAQLRFTTTAGRGTQQLAPFGVDVLRAWHEGEVGSVRTPLEQLLSTQQPDECTYLTEQELWDTFIGSVDWQFDQPELAELTESIESRVAARAPKLDAPALARMLLATVLECSAREDVSERVLTAHDLTDKIEAFDEAWRNTPIAQGLEALEDAVLGELRRLPRQFLSALRQREQAAQAERIDRLLAPGQRELPEQLSPVSLLRAVYAVVPFAGRERELELLTAWLDRSESAALSLVTAPGGLGKTRLAAELVERAKEFGGWHAGFLLRGKDPAPLFEGERPRLVVVDYAETRRTEVLDLVRRMVGHTGASVRVLLLAREGGDLLARVVRDESYAEPLVSGAVRFELRALATSLAERESLFQDATGSFARNRGARVPTSLAPDLGAPHYDRVLFIHSAALHAVLGGQIGGTADELLDGILEHEAGYWNKLVEGELSGTAAAEARYGSGGRLVLATLTLVGGARDEAEARRLVQAALSAETVDATIRGLVRCLIKHLGPGREDQGSDDALLIRPLEPDLLGERLVSRAFEDRHDLLHDLFYLDGGARSEAIVTVLNRVVSRDPGAGAEARRSSLLYAVLERRVEDWLERAIEMGASQGGALGRVLAQLLEDRDAGVELAGRARRAVPDETVSLREVGLWASQTIVERSSQSSTVSQSAEVRAANLGHLSIWYSRSGRPEEALAAEEEAISLYRDLAAARPETFRPELARSLSNLGSYLSENGRPAEALAATEEATALRREQALADPAFRPDLALSLSNLGLRLSENGRPADALAATEEATALRREQAEAAPDAFRPKLALSLSNLGIRLSESGRPEDALAAAEEGTALYRELAAAQPDAFRPYLAVSLSNLGNRLSQSGRREEALAAEEQATALRRELAAVNPDAFRPDLARSLSNLAIRLSEHERHEEALAAEGEATALRRELAAARPDAFRPDLARSLSNLGIYLSEHERFEEAQAAEEEAIVLRRDLAEARPDAFRPGLATSLTNLGIYLAKNGRPEEALAAAEEAVALRHEIATGDPNAFRPVLARSLSHLVDRLKENDRHDQAHATAIEAVDTLSSSFLEHPRVHARWMRILVNDYRRLSTEQDLPIDEAWLAPIERQLEQLEQLDTGSSGPAP